VLEQFTRLGIESVRPLLPRRVREEPSAKIRAAIQQLLAAAAPVEVDETAALPPLPEIDTAARLSAETEAAFRAIFRAYNRHIAQLKPAETHGRPVEVSNTYMTDEQVDNAWQLLQEGAPGTAAFAYLSEHSIGSRYRGEVTRLDLWTVRKEISAFLACPEVQPLHLVRFHVLLRVFDALRAKTPTFYTMHYITGYIRTSGQWNCASWPRSWERWASTWKPWRWPIWPNTGPQSAGKAMRSGPFSSNTPGPCWRPWGPGRWPTGSTNTLVPRRASARCRCSSPPR